MLQEMKLEDALKKFLKGRKVLVLYNEVTSTDKPVYGIEPLREMLEGMQFLVDVPAIEDLELKQEVEQMRRSVKIMRLIDADDFIKKFSYAKANTKEENLMCAVVRRMIKEQPTAFDLDKAISELKRDKFVESECILSDVHQGYNAGLSRAIEIVKGGGVE